jgi:hypothetical protein
MAYEPVAGMTTAEAEIQIPTWNLGGRILIEPRIWDADMPQVEVGAADEDVDIVTMDDSEITPACLSLQRSRRRRNGRRNGRKRRTRSLMAG